MGARNISTGRTVKLGRTLKQRGARLTQQQVVARRQKKPTIIVDHAAIKAANNQYIKDLTGIDIQGYINDPNYIKEYYSDGTLKTVKSQPIIIDGWSMNKGYYYPGAITEHIIEFYQNGVPKSNTTYKYYKSVTRNSYYTGATRRELETLFDNQGNITHTAEYRTGRDDDDATYKAREVPKYLRDWKGGVLSEGRTWSYDGNTDDVNWYKYVNYKTGEYNKTYYQSNQDNESGIDQNAFYEYQKQRTQYSAYQTQINAYRNKKIAAANRVPKIQQLQVKITRPTPAELTLLREEEKPKYHKEVLLNELYPHTLYSNLAKPRMGSKLVYAKETGKAASKIFLDPIKGYIQINRDIAKGPGNLSRKDQLSIIKDPIGSFKKLSPEKQAFFGAAGLGTLGFAGRTGYKIARGAGLGITGHASIQAARDPTPQKVGTAIGLSAVLAPTGFTGRKLSSTVKQTKTFKTGRIKLLEQISKAPTRSYRDLTISKPVQPIDRYIFNYGKKSGGVLGGSRAIEAHGIKLTRYKGKPNTGDVDLIYPTKKLAYKHAQSITKQLNKKFGGGFKVHQKGVSTQIQKGNNHWDIVTEKVPTRTIDGYKVLKIERQLTKKLDPVRAYPRKKYRLKKDLQDFTDIVNYKLGTKLHHKSFFRNKKGHYAYYGLTPRTYYRFIKSGGQRLPYYLNKDNKTFPRYYKLNEKYSTPSYPKPYTKTYYPKYSPTPNKEDSKYSPPNPYKNNTYYSHSKTKIFSTPKLTYITTPDRTKTQKKKIKHTNNQYQKAYQPIYSTKKGWKKGNWYKTEKEATDAARHYVDNTQENLFKIQKGKTNKQLLNFIAKQKIEHKFQKTGPRSYKEKPAYRKDKKNEWLLTVLKRYT